MKQQTNNFLLSVEGRSIASVEMGRVESIPMVWYDMVIPKQLDQAMARGAP